MRASDQKGIGAVLRGRVIDAHSGRPLSRARIGVVGADHVSEVTSDSEGNYQVPLAPGRYWIRVERQGYLPAYYGQTRADEAPRSIFLISGEVRGSVDVALERPGVLAGRVLDDIGESVEAAVVLAFGADLHMARTNDIGEFRIPRLSPGRYVVWALAPHPVARVDDAVYVPTYVPGTPDREAAVPVTVGAAVETRADIVLIPGNITEVEGVVRSRAGMPITGAEVTLSIDYPGRTGGHRTEVASSLSGSDGGFVLRRVPPGRYRLRASRGDERGEIDVEVGDAKVQGLAVTATTGTTLVGNLSVQTMGIKECRNPVITLSSVRWDDWNERSGQRVRADSQGRFEIANVHGAQRFRVRCPDHAMVTHLVVNGRRVEGNVLDVSALDDMARVEVAAILSGSTTEGVVRDEEGRPCECVVLTLRADPDSWQPPDDFLWITRTGGGTFRFMNLPPGDYVALVEPFGVTRWDPDYLRAARSRGVPFRSERGSRVTLTLQCR